MTVSNMFSRRGFITHTSYLGAFNALARTMPLPALAQTAGIDSRASSTPLVDKGFASVRKIGSGLYATISDPSKGVTTDCNGGFLVGKDAALLIEGSFTAAGASFQMAALHSVSQVPVKGALDTHYHFDHTMGNAFYGANGIPIWAHASVAQRMIGSYGPLQGAEKAAVPAPFEKRVRDATSGSERQHAGSDLNIITMLFQLANSSVLALPNHPIDRAKLPMNIDLGVQEGIAILRETFDDITVQAEKMFESGVPVQEAANRYIVPAKFKNFPIYAWDFTIGAAITKLYAEWQAQ